MNNKFNLSLIILVVLCLCEVFSKNVDHSRSKRTTTVDNSVHSCDNVKPFFESRNITIQSSVNGPKGKDETIICSIVFMCR